MVHSTVAVCVSGLSQRIAGSSKPVPKNIATVREARLRPKAQVTVWMVYVGSGRENRCTPKQPKAWIDVVAVQFSPEKSATAREYQPSVHREVERVSCVSAGF